MTVADLDMRGVTGDRRPHRPRRPQPELPAQLRDVRLARRPGLMQACAAAGSAASLVRSRSHASVRRSDSFCTRTRCSMPTSNNCIYEQYC